MKLLLQSVSQDHWSLNSATESRAKTENLESYTAASQRQLTS